MANPAAVELREQEVAESHQLDFEVSAELGSRGPSASGTLGGAKCRSDLAASASSGGAVLSRIIC